MPSPEYERYMHSETWQEKRRMRLAFDDYECRNCHSTRRLQVHHWYYWREGKSILGREQMEDLVTLCVPCHLAMTQRRQDVFGTGRQQTSQTDQQEWILWLGLILMFSLMGGMALWVFLLR
jgi:hypothetical protein